MSGCDDSHQGMSGGEILSKNWAKTSSMTGWRVSAHRTEMTMAASANEEPVGERLTMLTTVTGDS